MPRLPLTLVAAPQPCYLLLSPMEASAIATGQEAPPASASDPLAAGRRVSDTKTSFLTALVAQLLVLLPSRNLLA